MEISNDRADSSTLSRLTRCVIVAALFSIASINGASASYIGQSFMQVPGIDGKWAGDQYTNWISVDAHYWETRTTLGAVGLRSILGGKQNYYSGPYVVAEGESAVALAIDKKSPALPKLMEMCANKTPIDEILYAENSEFARTLQELGPRPDGMPEYFEYKLKDAAFIACQVADGAPEQAFILRFKDIEWLNYQPIATDSDDKEEFVIPDGIQVPKGIPRLGEPEIRGEGIRVSSPTELPDHSLETEIPPAVLEPADITGKSKSFVVTWFGPSNDMADDQCPNMNAEPTEDDYYALMTKEAADKERVALKSMGGVNYQNGQMALRGPNKLDACSLPGIVPDPGHFAPQTTLARGLNLDGDDGKSDPPAGVCPHKNYTATDGRTGIDNQLYSVLGCVAGYQGHKGFMLQYKNEQKRNGSLSIIVRILGIDDEKNDDEVYVDLLYSKDPMAKSGSGAQVLPYYTFRLTDLPQYTYFFTRLPGRIENGAVVTDQVDFVQMNPEFGVPLELYNARMRIDFEDNGNMKAVLGGYEDWRAGTMTMLATGNSERLNGYTCPGVYNALKRAADGLMDPVTGECNGISSAYDIEGVPAFVIPDRREDHEKQAQVDMGR